MAMHTLFVREHNRVAKKLEELNGRIWSQEQIFLEARKIVAAVTQHITYNEFLKQILNCKTVSKLRSSNYVINYATGIMQTFCRRCFHVLLGCNILYLQVNALSELIIGIYQTMNEKFRYRTKLCRVHCQ